MSLTYRTWVLIRSCFEALPLRASRVGAGRKWRRTARTDYIEMLEERQLMAGTPTLTNISKSVHLNVAQSSFSFTAADFTAAFNEPGATLQTVEITSLPSAGTLALNTQSVAIGTTISAADLSQLTYFYNPTSTYTGSDSFSWNASDGTNQAAVQANVNITLADKAPTNVNITKNVDENSSPRFPLSDFTGAFSDPDGGDTLYQVTINTLPAHGTLEILGGDTSSPATVNGTAVNVTAGDVLGLGQIANLIYVPNAGFTGSDFFAWSGRDLEQYPATASNVLLNVVATPSLAVYGGGFRIASGTTTTSAGNFTDFGGMVTPADSNIGTDTRTYTITNNSNSTITLNGNSANQTNFVKISGADAADFTVITEPANATLAPGDSTTFTIGFAPGHNGERDALITIPNSSSDVGSYKFAVSGTGLVLNQAIAGSTIIDAGSTVLGAGNGTVAGDEMFVNYSGFVLNYTPTTGVPTGLSGTVFDSTTNEGGSPFTFTLGQSQVITGWDSGLVGMKVGETRILLLPAGAAYDGTGNGAVPPDATLEFAVTLLKVVKPTVAVTGVTSGTKTTSTANGTDFGTLSNGTVSSAANTFTITTGAGALTGATVTVTGADPADFVVTQPAGTGTTETFTVTFTPTLTGTRTAIININDSAATNKSYTFAVKGTSASYVDIRPLLGTTPKFPTTVITGNAKTFNVPLTIQNVGTTALGKGLSTDVHFFLKNMATGVETDFANDTATLKLKAIPGGGQSQTFNLPITIPASLPIGRYTLVAVINGKNGVPELVTSNDTATGIQIFGEETFQSDITGSLVSATTTSVVSGRPVSGSVVVAVQNTGNKPLPAGQQVKISIIAHSSTTGTDTTLTTSQAFSVSKLAKGAKAQNFTVTFSNVAGLAADTYTYEAQITPVQTLAESSTSNNLVTTTASNGTLSIASVNPDISATLGTSTLPSSVVAGSATSTSGAVGVIVKNSGNIALTSDEQVTISILAHPTNGGSDIVLAAAGPTFDLGALAVGATKTINVGVQFAGTALTAGNYTLEAQVTPVPALTETSTTNNLATVNASNLTIGLTATA